MKNKKKSPGRPKKEFVSQKPKIKIKDGPGRPRKDHQYPQITQQITPAVAGFVAKSVDESQKKDLIILGLFLLSFILFMVSLYFTFMRDKKVEEVDQSEIVEINNMETGNIDQTKMIDTTQEDVTNTSMEEIFQPGVQKLSPEQQIIIDFYQAINDIDMSAIYILADARLEQSNVFKTYYSKNRLSKFSNIILEPKIVVTNIQEKSINSTNPNIKSFGYTIEYMIIKDQQKFTEERSTIVIKKGDVWRITKLMCETKGCSMMPFFNPDKYK